MRFETSVGDSVSTKKTKTKILGSVRPTCKICHISERQGVEQAREQGISYAMLTRYLQSVRGYEEITEDSVRNHFRRQH